MISAAQTGGNGQEKGNKSIANEESYSPLFSQCTQDERDNIEVMWDWHSPQSKPRIRTKPKRLPVQQSPKLLIKRHSSNNNINAFEKLKVELETLKNEIVNEQPNKTFNLSDFQDAFDDSMEEQLIICSQEIEHNLDKYLKPNDRNTKTPNCSTESLISFENISELFESPEGKSSSTLNHGHHFNQIADDSFDFILGSLNYEESDEMARNKGSNHRPPIHNCSQNKENDDSPIKCSPEEIEQKRLQALAKLEAKKRQEIIERNRQQALKRLEMNKKKRSLQCNTLTSKRTHET